jgi:hypothetical protein
MTKTYAIIINTNRSVVTDYARKCQILVTPILGTEKSFLEHKSKTALRKFINKIPYLLLDENGIDAGFDALVCTLKQ